MPKNRFGYQERRWELSREARQERNDRRVVMALVLFCIGMSALILFQATIR